MRPHKRQNLNTWKVLCCKTNKERLVIPEIKIIEFLLCVICLLVILLEHLNFAVYSEAIISLTVFYMTVTFADIIFIFKWWPTGWLIFSMTGALFFSACVGLSFYIDDALAYTVLVGITAVVFLLDGLCTLKEQAIKSCQEYHEHITTSQISSLSAGHNEYEENTSHSNRGRADERQDSHSSKHETNTVDEEKFASSWGDNAYRISLKERNLERSKSKEVRNQRSEFLAKTKVSRYAKNLQDRHSSRHMHTKRETSKSVAPSYGGTFHVSRDTAPMACPFVNLQEVPQNEIYEEQVWRNDFRKSNRSVQSATLRNSADMNLTPLRPPFSATKYRNNSTKNQNDFGNTSTRN